MERLTERSENGKAVYRHPTPEPSGWEANRNAVLERCCRYEETGLEPEEVQHLKDKSEPRMVVWTPAYQSYYSAGDEAECFCPVCDSNVVEEDDYFCPTCGQALKYHDEPQN